ncbi:MAG: LysR family transcriptional regulator [Coriobacteriales bacterium]|nr:LysR family transcriptional regulator [Coriobacteriales bacterium]
MEIRVLRYFLAVAREQSISGAAKVLNVTQPTLSRQLQDLERELGKQLLIRGSRRVTLTEEGMLLRKRATEIVDLVDRTKAEISSSEDDVCGTIAVGSGETEAMLYIIHAVQRLRARHPGIKLSVLSGDPQDVSESLDSGVLDFGLFVEPAELAKYEAMKLPVEDRWGALVRSDSPLARGMQVRPAQLSQQPLIMSRQSEREKIISNWFGKDVSQLNVVGTYNLVYNASLMVREGMGVALTVEGLVNTDADPNLTFLPLEPKLTMDIDVVWKKHRVLSRAAELFLQVLQDESMERMANQGTAGVA